MTDFKVGDIVACYGPLRYIGIVNEIITDDDQIFCKFYEPIYGMTGKWFHKKQCRKLVKKKNKLNEFMNRWRNTSKVIEKELNKKKLNEFVFDIDEFMNIALKVEEDIRKNTFDPTKPVQTREGKKARIVCTDVYGSGTNENICALIKTPDWEYSLIYKNNGKYFSSGDSELDLINIPEEKKLDVHVGGIYKCRNGKYAVCLTDDSEDDSDELFWTAFIHSKPGCMTGYVNSLGKRNDNDLSFDLIKYLCDIEDIEKLTK